MKNRIQDTKYKILNTKKAFTLVEILVAIGIVSIMSAVVLVSMNEYGKKARASKAQAQLSSALPNMISCWGNGGNVVAPDSTGGENICSIGSSYGTWPNAGSGTDLATYSFSSSNPGGNLTKNDWFITLASGSTNDKIRTCCNSVMKNCKLQNWKGPGPAVWDEDCTKTTPTY